MIIEQPFKANDTITIKTTAGDEIVARYVKDDEKTLTVKKPLALMGTQQGIGLGPYAFTVSPDAELKLNKSAVVFVAKTEDQMASQYLSSTSGIQSAGSMPNLKI